ncbi:MAG: PAS domain S-box protein [Actinobacteria bacterium]|nr:PAS domain S-box protein [Actinomycetota bacterium]
MRTPRDAAAMVLLDVSGAVVATNPAWDEFARATGADPALFAVGSSSAAFCPTAGLPSSTLTEQVLAHAVRGDHAVPMRLQVDWAVPGGSRPFLLHAASRFADDGSCLGATMTLEAVPGPGSSRRGADSWTRLRDPERLITHTLDTVDDAVVILEAPSLLPVYVNRAGLTWLGPAADRVPLRGSGRPLSEAALDEILGALEQVASAAADRIDLTVPAVRDDGEQVWLDLRLCALPSAGARPEHVLVVAHDITAQVRTEERLRISEKSFRAAFERSPIPTSVTLVDEDDGGRRIVMANQALADVLGLPLDDLIGLDAAVLNDPEEEREARSLAQAFAASSHEHFSRRKRHTRPDGATVWSDVFVTRIDVAGDEATAALVHLLDVTDRVLLAFRKQRQQDAMTAHATLVTSVLAGDDQSLVEQRMLDSLRDVFAADDVLLAVQDRSSDEVVVVRGSGPRAARLAAARAPLDPDVVRSHFEHRQTMLTPGRDGADLVAAARFDVDSRLGWVAVARAVPPFDADELQILGSFSRQSALALELGRARADQDRLGRLEERQRLARDLHDTVLQDLIAIGVQLGLLRGTLTGQAESRVVEVMRELVGTVRTLRGAVFQLRRPLEEDSFEDTVRAVIGSAARALGHQPTLTVKGDLGRVPRSLVADLAAALQESLSNVIRHAAATTTHVSVDVADDRIVLEVADDGAGPRTQGPTAGHGLANLADRARAAGGTSVLRPGAVRGAVLTWQVPVPPPDDTGLPVGTGTA